MFALICATIQHTASSSANPVSAAQCEKSCRYRLMDVPVQWTGLKYLRSCRSLGIFTQIGLYSLQKTMQNISSVSRDALLMRKIRAERRHWADRRFIVMQIITIYSRGEQKSMSACTKHQPLKSSIRRHHHALNLLITISCTTSAVFLSFCPVSNDISTFWCVMRASNWSSSPVSVLFNTDTDN